MLNRRVKRRLKSKDMNKNTNKIINYKYNCKQLFQSYNKRKTNARYINKS